MHSLRALVVRVAVNYFGQLQIPLQLSVANYKFNYNQTKDAPVARCKIYPPSKDK